MTTQSEKKPNIKALEHLLTDGAPRPHILYSIIYFNLICGYSLLYLLYFDSRFKVNYFYIKYIDIIKKLPAKVFALAGSSLLIVHMYYFVVYHLLSVCSASFPYTVKSLFSRAFSIGGIYAFQSHQK